MPTVPFAQFTRKVLSVYTRRRKTTRKKVEQVLDEFGLICQTSADITPSAITIWLESYPLRKPITAFSLLRSFQSACTTAVKEHLLDESPFTGFWSPAQYWPDGQLDPPENAPYLTAGQMSRLLVQSDLEAVGGSWEAARRRFLAYMYVCTGCRKSEALGLMAADLNLVVGTIWIRGNARRTLKNRASRRCLFMPGMLAGAAADWAPRCGSIWMVPNKRRTGPWTEGPRGKKPLDELKALAARAGIDPFTILMVRHGYATAFTGGELALQMQLGHRHTRTQIGYRHVDPAMMRDNANRFYLPPR
jgi:integrase